MNNALFSIFLKTVLLSFFMLIGLSLSMWVLAYYSLDPHRYASSGLIDTVQARVEAPLSAAEPPIPISTQKSIAASAAAAIAAAQAPPRATQVEAKASRILLRFEHQEAQLRPEEVEGLQTALANLDIDRNDHIRITAGAVSADQRLNKELVLKLRTQAIARIAFMHTQQVEIALGEPLAKAGVVALDINLPAMRKKLKN